MVVRLETPAIERGQLVACMAQECEFAEDTEAGGEGRLPGAATLSNTNQDASDDETLSAASIAAIVIACVFGIGVIMAAGVAYFIYRTRTGQMLNASDTQKTPVVKVLREHHM